MGQNWSIVGAYVVIGQLNGRPPQQRDGESPYKICYGKHTKAAANYILNHDLIKYAQSEYGLKAIQLIMDAVSKKNPNAVFIIE